MQWQKVSSRVGEFIAEQQLPASFMALSETFYFPLAQQLVAQNHSSTRPLLVGINGAQGTGKSTLAALLGCMLEAGTGWRCAILSIDDLYRTRTEREQLAQGIHPLLKVRGVPGTHDIDLGLALIDQLLMPHTSTPLTPLPNPLTHPPTNPRTTRLALPRFNKAIDDRKPTEEWHQQSLPVDMVIVEGWCIGAVPQPDAQLSTAINDLERNYDPDGTWRHYVNQQLAGNYQTLFNRLDYLVMLKAPTMECIEEWRWLQEQKLIAATGGKGEGLMNQAQVKHFIQHYERLTRHLLEEMPTRADWVFHLNKDHEIAAVSGAKMTGTTQGLSL